VEIQRQQYSDDYGIHNINLSRRKNAHLLSDRSPNGGNVGANEEPPLRIGSNHGEKQGLSAQGEPIICKKLLFLHRCGTEQPARFQADIHFAVRICRGRVFLTETTGGGCRQWNDDGREATMLDSVYFCKRKKQSSNCNHSDFLHHIGKR
jgi:hypothetical protein